MVRSSSFQKTSNYEQIVRINSNITYYNRTNSHIPTNAFLFIVYATPNADDKCNFISTEHIFEPHQSFFQKAFEINLNISLRRYDDLFDVLFFVPFYKVLSNFLFNSFSFQFFSASLFSFGQFQCWSVNIQDYISATPFVFSLFHRS